jgi:hypothetical protein
VELAEQPLWTKQFRLSDTGEPEHQLPERVHGDDPVLGAGFDKNFDMTLYSKWTLTSGQDITMLSGENTTNITLDNNTIRNKYIPQGVGARPGVGECAYNGQDCQ